MKQITFDSSLSIEKRVNKIETVLSRILRKVHKTTSAIISPQLISATMKGDINGTILSAMLFRGRISKAAVFLNKKPKTPVAIEARMLSGEGGISKTFYADRMRKATVLNVDTYDGTILNVNVKCNDEEINEIYIALLWTPTVSDSTVKKQMIDALEGSEDEYLIEE
jgi:hypothetical protein